MPYHDFYLGEVPFTVSEKEKFDIVFSPVSNYRYKMQSFREIKSVILECCKVCPTGLPTCFCGFCLHPTVHRAHSAATLPPPRRCSSEHHLFHLSGPTEVCPVFRARII